MKKMKILMIDDDLGQLELISRLKLPNHEVHWVSAVFDAVQILERRKTYFDLVLCDIVGTVKLSPEHTAEEIQNTGYTGTLYFTSAAVTQLAAGLNFVEKTDIATLVDGLSK